MRCIICNESIMKGSRAIIGEISVACCLKHARSLRSERREPLDFCAQDPACGSTMAAEGAAEKAEAAGLGAHQRIHAVKRTTGRLSFPTFIQGREGYTQAVGKRHDVRWNGGLHEAHNS